MTKLKLLAQKFRSLFNDSQWEAFKEVCRWVVFFVVSDVAIQLLDQAVRVPETWVINVWVFDYTIHTRFLFTTGLTLIIRYLDKLKHLNYKELFPTSKKAGGILPF